MKSDFSRKLAEKMAGKKSSKALSALVKAQTDLREIHISMDKEAEQQQSSEYPDWTRYNDLGREYLSLDALVLTRVQELRAAHKEDGLT